MQMFWRYSYIYNYEYIWSLNFYNLFEKSYMYTLFYILNNIIFIYFIKK